MIYFIRQEDDSLVKIGKTEDIKHRLSTLQVSNGRKLEVVLLISGGIKKERELHNLFADDRYRGEWYFVSDDIRSYIKSQYDNDLRTDNGLSNDIDESSKIRFLRNKDKLSLTDIGRMLNVSAQSVKEAERREQTGAITLNNLKKYGKAMGYELVYGFTKKDNDS